MNFTANERRKINTAKRASELQQLRQERDTAREERAGLAIQIGMLITERNELRAKTDRLYGLYTEAAAMLRETSAAFNERSQALNERANAQCRAENERDALRACLVRCFGHIDDFSNTLENAGANIAATKAEASRLLSTIAAPEITSIRATITAAPGDAWLKNRTGFVRP